LADLITHTCAAVLWKCVTRGPLVGTFVLGTCLPDLLGRVPPMALTVARWTLPWIPEWTIYAWGPLHMPVGILLGSYLCSFLFAEASRRAVFANLLGGGLVHLAVDVLQRHFGVGYLLFFPFSTFDWELGWIGSEDTVKIVPVLLPFTLLMARRRLRGGRGVQELPNAAP
jgi:hypothetical protein